MSSSACFISSAETVTPIYLATKADWEVGLNLPAGLKAQADASGFRAAAGDTVLSASAEGGLDSVLFGLGDGADALSLAGLSADLPQADYEIARDGGVGFAQICAGWADGAYRFDRYLKTKAKPPRLVVGAGEDAVAVMREAAAIHRLRDMVNTPAEDMGPACIEQVIRALASAHGANVHCVEGEALLQANYPMIHAVGRAGPEAPRLIELSWGEEGAPELAIVGKGVTFDTGGLNIKPGNSMRLMKKDMGGAAHAIALADLVMGAALPVRLKLYIPAVENAVAGNAFRPSDILQSRKGLSVEIDNTDAEGRLVLADALSRACESAPDLVVDFATLTGAARVAVGPEIAPFYTDDDTLAGQIDQGVLESGDPAWRMPLWDPYLSMLKSPVADLVNSASGGMAGSITAALFLKQFVDAKSWVHFDVWAWRQAKYGRPEGGAATGLRATWHAVQARYR